MSKTWKAVYYLSTVFFSLGMLLGGYFDITLPDMARDAFLHLGYPMYLGMIIGVAKILGVIGIWQRKSHTLVEWAYAGFTIDLLGAFASHIAVGDGADMYMGSLIYLAVMVVSYKGYRKMN